jgi:hypothetical protein
MRPNISQVGVSFANPKSIHLNLLVFVPHPQPTWSKNSINRKSETSGVLTSKRGLIGKIAAIFEGSMQFFDINVFWA